MRWVHPPGRGRNFFGRLRLFSFAEDASPQRPRPPRSSFERHPHRLKPVNPLPTPPRDSIPVLLSRSFVAFLSRRGSPCRISVRKWPRNRVLARKDGVREPLRRALPAKGQVASSGRVPEGADLCQNSVPWPFSGLFRACGHRPVRLARPAVAPASTPRRASPQVTASPSFCHSLTISPPFRHTFVTPFPHAFATPCHPESCPSLSPQSPWRNFPDVFSTVAP